ncbi:hypothetical protein [Mycobacterium botniense]|uniref:Uncharacterized protein n=1 Tax=Mycobacterium botniense TaxID=84962 RepID=A0A7I9XY27_9MYCO|nr:hypothetical protein [Mycobacterium botniense]GFG74709.1 hypothetical protein MBOT_20740 [Mycobacterium botniense]GFG74738.1 hypothetical protein MBOT_21030 [Mycobacterium botniense]
MPKRTEVIKKIQKAAKARNMQFTIKRHGGNHDIYDLDGAPIPIPRHREIINRDAEGIYKECEIKLGKGWWR